MKPEFYDFMNLFEENLTVNHIASKLICWNIKTETKEDAFKKMEDKNLDLLPIYENGQITEYITKNKVRKKIEISDIVSDSTPLTHILHFFRENPIKKLFILRENKLESIVTIGDLQKGPFLLLIFGLMINFEILCHELINDYYDSEWENSLNPDILEEITKDFIELKEKGEDIDKLYCTSLSQKINLILRMSDINIDLEDFKELKSKLEKIGHRIIRLRNNLVHIKRIKTEFKDWKDIIEVIEAVQFISERLNKYLKKKRR